MRDEAVMRRRLEMLEREAHPPTLRLMAIIITANKPTMTERSLDRIITELHAAADRIEAKR